jgi:HK97 family phage major capsid protein
MYVNEMRTKRMTAVNEARAILTKAREEKRDLTSEEDGKHGEIMADVAKMRVDIEREERTAAAEAELRTVVQEASRLEVGEDAEQRTATGVLASPEYRDAFYAWAATGAESRALEVGGATKGETLVPEEMFRGIIERLAQPNTIRSICRVITTESTMPIPVSTGYGAAAWTDESASYSESDDTFSEVILNAYKSTRIIKISDELLQDERVNLMGHLADSFGRSFSELEEASFADGDGSSKPTGVTVGASAGITVASPTAITADELKEFKAKLKSQYRGNSKFLLNSDTELIVDKLVIASEAGNYIWRPGLVQGVPDTLLGRPVVVSEAMPAPTAGNVSVCYGDFDFYWIGDRGTVGLKRLDELYAANGQVGFAASRRVDAKIVQAEAIKALTMAAS